MTSPNAVGVVADPFGWDTSDPPPVRVGVAPTLMSNETQAQSPVAADATRTFLRGLGVRELAPRTCPFDPGYDPATVVAHLRQSAGLMSLLKLSMSCWLVADEGSTRAKIEAARGAGVRIVVGGGPFEIAAAQGQLGAYLDLCAELGVNRIEAGSGFTELRETPAQVVGEAERRGLETQFEVGK